MFDHLPATCIIRQLRSPRQARGITRSSSEANELLLQRRKTNTEPVPNLRLPLIIRDRILRPPEGPRILNRTKGAAANVVSPSAVRVNGLFAGVSFLVAAGTGSLMVLL